MTCWKMNLETPNLQQKNNSGLELKKSRFIKKNWEQIPGIFYAWKKWMTKFHVFQVGWEHWVYKPDVFPNNAVHKQTPLPEVNWALLWASNKIVYNMYIILGICLESISCLVWYWLFDLYLPYSSIWNRRWVCLKLKGGILVWNRRGDLLLGMEGGIFCPDMLMCHFVCV